MASTREKCVTAEQELSWPATRPASRDVWDVLDQCVVDLEHCEDASNQVSCALKAIRDGLQAEAVFTYPSMPGQKVEVLSDRPLSTAWCRRFVEQQLEAFPAHGDSHVRLAEAAECLTGAPWKPVSTLMVRLIKSRPLWVVALNFQGHRYFRKDDLKIAMLIRRLFRNQRRQTLAREKLTHAMLGVVRGLNEAISAKCPFTSGHSERVARMAVCLGRQMGLSAAVLSDLYLAGLLHDVGKIGIRDSVLQKQAALTDEEYAHIREHPVIGDTIVSRIQNLAHLRPGVRNHHERFDGLGYPDGLVGNAIPLLARILSIVDACDAMMSPRPYRPGLPTEQVDAILTAGAGTQWDPQLVEHFMACRKELYCIYEKGLGDSMLHAIEESVDIRQED